jgi:hypothetical protein
LLFEEYASHRIATLGREAGEPIICYYREEGLPTKLVFFPIFDGDEPTDPPLKMRLVAPGGGHALHAYLKQLGLEDGVDFERHGNSQRSGLICFDILTDSAVQILSGRADALARPFPTDRTMPGPDRSR